MQTFMQNVDNLSPRRGLHRVWESIREGDRTRLVARWIEPKTEKSQSYKNGDAMNDDEAAGRGLLSVCLSPNPRPCFRRLRSSTVAAAA